MKETIDIYDINVDYELDSNFEEFVRMEQECFLEHEKDVQ